MVNRYSDEEEDVFQPIKQEGEEDFISVDYLDRPKEKKVKETHKAEAKPEFKEEKKEIKIEPKKETPAWEPSKSNPSFGKDEDSFWSKAGTWQFIALLLAITLVAAVFTNGFGLTGKAVASSITPSEAEQKALGYINSNLLQPPFTATAVKTEELNGMYKIKIDVAGRQIDSYVTKDGKLFFPQGLELDAALPSVDGKDTTPAPEATKISVDLAGEPVKGKADAPVTIVEFSDFQCPFCQKGWEVMKEVEKDYVAKNKVKLVFKNFPLDNIHPMAQASAQAGECAHEQDKFWEYHDKLFANQQSLSNDNLKKWAKEVGLDENKFNSCFESKKYESEVAKDQQEGLKAGVQGTPAFLINGQLYSGALPYAQIKQLIETELAKAAAGNTPAAVTETVKEVENTAQETVKAIETKPAQTTELKVSMKKFVFTPAELTVGKGNTVKLIVANTADIKLGYEVSAFNADKDVEAGQTAELSFTADKAGTYDIICNSACGSKKGAILGALVVK
ncbi:thioredoxin domain-containing protein [Candidatus Woesearchaeota archaeon]|nr:thioredoxin domain-containing protein [Candidatus Woesearchaeota archaeon]